MSDTSTHAEVLKRDVYPAQVLLPSGKLLRGVRAFVSSTRVVVYGNPNATGPEIVYEAELETEGFVPASGNTLGSNERIEARLSDGTVWITKDRGCGCGSPLKAMSAPWPRRVPGS